MVKYGCRVKSGDVYGKLTVIELHEKRGKHNIWKCMCACGKVMNVYATNLQTGHTKSCGCLTIQFCKETFSTHGKSKTRLYGIWKRMRARCNNSSDSDYCNYGGRGITVCKEWGTFERFYTDMLEGYSDNLTIERIDPNKGYFIENCKWIPASEQSLNKTRFRNNKTGACGVSYRVGRFCFVASWSDISGKQKSKSFSCKKYGSKGAFEMACKHRELMITSLKEQGVNYSIYNGVDKESIAYDSNETDVSV